MSTDFILHSLARHRRYIAARRNQAGKAIAQKQLSPVGLGVGRQGQENVPHLCRNLFCRNLFCSQNLEYLRKIENLWRVDLSGGLPVVFDDESHRRFVSDSDVISEPEEGSNFRDRGTHQFAIGATWAENGNHSSVSVSSNPENDHRNPLLSRGEST
jgi:hypothetical protein